MTDSSLPLHQLVKANSAGFTNAVDFGMMNNPEQNRQLCEGFIFNYEDNQPKNSTVGILNALREGFHSPGKPSIHLMVQDYGKGKSHFALTVANFFQKPSNSEEVRSILTRVENAVGSESHILLQQLRSYKERGRHLVFCLSGVDVFDLRQEFLDVVQKTLANEGITGTKAQNIVGRPLEFLHQVVNKPEEKAQAEVFLRPQGYDLPGLIQKLEAADTTVVPIVTALAEHIRELTPDFRPHVKVKEILEELIQKYCRGENARYRGILVIFDELHKYLQQWADTPLASGNAALQEMTEVCENYRNNISLLCLSIRRPLTFTPSKNQEDYKLLATRLEMPNSTYEPAASLELVLKNLIQQKTDTSTWQDFYRRWQDTLEAESRAVYRERTRSYYTSHHWNEDTFFNTVGVNCFPLHPLTTYLLCNLNFTQGRRILQFVEGDRHGIASFIREQPAEIDGHLNFLRPVVLVDAFEDNFANPEANIQYIGLYGNYRSALTKLQAASNVDPDEFLLLKALFLYYASVDKITSGPHSEILAMMTGLAAPKVRQVLRKLHEVRRVIYPDTSGKIYDFFRDGADPDSLRQKLREATAATEASIDLVVSHCQTCIDKNSYVTSITEPKRFIQEKHLRAENWFFQNRVVNAATLRAKIGDDTWLKDLQDANARGRVIYVLAEKDEEITALNTDIDALLEKSPLKDRLVIAVSNRPTANLARQLLELNHLSTITQENTAAATQIRQDYERQINDQIRNLFSSCTYHCDPVVMGNLPPSETVRCEAIVSALLEHHYRLAPPIASNDKMVGGRNAKVLRDIMMQLLVDNLRPPFSNRSYDTVIDQVLIGEWQILEKQGQMYRVKEPNNRNIKAAWDKISAMTALDDQDDKRVNLADIWDELKISPFGYHEHAFTALLCAWMAAHRKEILLVGKASTRSGSRTERHPVKDWVENTEIFSKSNELMNWIRRGNAQLVRRKPSARPEIPSQVDYDAAKTLMQEIDACLEFEVDDTVRGELEISKQQISNCLKQIDKACQPFQQISNYLRDPDANYPLTGLLEKYQSFPDCVSPVSDSAVTVIPTTVQQDMPQIARQSLEEAIGRSIQALIHQQQPLSSPEQCRDYKQELENYRNQLSELPQFARFIDDIARSIRKVDEQISFIQETEKCRQSIQKVRALYDGLSSTANQQDYEDCLQKIESEAKSIPIIRQQPEYQNILHQIQQKQEQLITQLKSWENNLAETPSKQALKNIREQIIRQQIRYTNTDCEQTISTLVVRIDNAVKAHEQAELESDYEKVEQKIVDLFQNLPSERQFNLLARLQALQTDQERNR